MNTKLLPALLSLLVFVSTAFAQTTSTPQASTGNNVLLTVSGTVEIAKAGSAVWEAGRQSQTLNVGDRVRTAKNSRATVRFSNLSILRVHELTTLEIQPPPNSSSNPTLDVKGGSVYMLNRDKPGTTQFRTPAASGAIRGTEFNLAVAEDGRMLLTLVDGEVNIQNELGSLELKTGEQAMVEPGKAPEKTASVDAINVIQWTLYYPGVVNVDELAFGDDLKVHLAPSLDSYRAGDLLKAVDSYPWDRESASPEDKVYRAALWIAAGKVDQAENLLQNLGEGTAPQVGEALKMLVAAVKNQKIAHGHSHNLATALMASSYYHQSQGELDEALADAKAAAEKAPNFGFAHARVAELEFSFGRTADAMTALDKSLSLSPRNAQALALKGFLLAAQNKIADARASFEKAIETDGNLGNAWLGRGLSKIKKGDVEGGRKDLETAASLEPNRAIFRSYLGKAWSMGRPWMYSWDQTLAKKELDLAKELDPNDPTSWLYSALLNQSQNQVNNAVNDLERSQDLNDNRRIFRSKLLLDQDRAVRGANLASVYRDAGMVDYSVREASRAVETDHLNFSAHQFLSDSYAALLDPKSITLRYETAWSSELLLANLLAPVGAGNLSQNISQQEYSRMFESDKFGLSSTTEYWTTGDWRERASQYGTFGNSSYALDFEYRKLNGTRPNNDLEDRYFSVKFKHQITPNDGVLFQIEDRHLSFGDTLQYYNNNFVPFPNARYKDVQEPNVYAGYHRQWSPGQHTLFLFGRLDDTFDVSIPNFGQDYAFLPPIALLPTAVASGLTNHSETVFYSFEAQHIAQIDPHTLVGGVRFQTGDTENTSQVGTTSGFLINNYQDTITTDFERYNFYIYDLWQVIDPLQLTLGVTYDHINYPGNTDIPPISSRQKTTDQISPKLGLRYTPCDSTTLRAAYTRSLGGLFSDSSIRLEPTQVAGFTQAYRSLVPESAGGNIPGSEFTTYGAGIEQTFPTRTYLTLDVEMLEADADRDRGFFNVGLPASFGAPLPITTSTLNEHIEYRERSLNFSVNQLLGEDWSVGGRYRISKANAEDVWPAAFGRTGSFAAVLNQALLFANYNHRCGFFARSEGVWFSQSNHGYSPDLPGDDVWQFNVFAGYRFPRRQAEIMVGLLNISDQDYKLNPLNYYVDYPRDRTMVVSAKFNF